MHGSYSISYYQAHFSTNFSISYHYVGDCGNLTDPENGMVRVSGTLEGDTAEYSCIEGYELNQNGTRICGPNETWSGEEPTCIGMLLTVRGKATRQC